VADLIRARRSVRRFRPEPPSREALTGLIEAAIAAPSAANRQPWRFLVVTDPDVIERMAAAVDGVVLRIARRAGDPAGGEFRSYAAHFSDFRRAPSLVVPLWRRPPLMRRVLGDDLPEEDRAAVEAADRDAGIVSASLAVENLLLAAPAAGLGAVLMTGPLLAMPALRRILEVPDRWRLLGIVAVGRPDEEPAPTSRKPVEKVTRWIERADQSSRGA